MAEHKGKRVILYFTVTISIEVFLHVQVGILMCIHFLYGYREVFFSIIETLYDIIRDNKNLYEKLNCA